MGNYFNELRWKIIRANNLLQPFQIWHNSCGSSLYVFDHLYILLWKWVPNSLFVINCRSDQTFINCKKHTSVYTLESSFNHTSKSFIFINHIKYMFIEFKYLSNWTTKSLSSSTLGRNILLFEKSLISYWKLNLMKPYFTALHFGAEKARSHSSLQSHSFHKSVVFLDRFDSWQICKTSYHRQISDRLILKHRVSHTPLVICCQLE